MYFSAADEAEFGQQAEHATVVEVGVYPEAACAALPGQCHGAAHEFGRYALSFDLLCDGQTVQDDVWDSNAVNSRPGRLLSRIFCCARSKTASVTRQTTLT